MPEFTANLLAPILIFVYLLTIDVRMAFVALIPMALGAVFAVGFFSGYDESYQKTIKTTKVLNDTAVEYVNGIEVIKAFSKTEGSYQKFVTAAKNNAAPFVTWMKRCAVREFMDKGFRGASLRKIVKDAGVTTGAFYKYYPTKEALFEGLVGPVAAGVSGIWGSSYRSFLAQTPPEQVSNMREHNAVGTREMVDYIYEHHDLMKLLLLASEGTRYATFVHDLALKQENAILSFMATQREGGVEVPEIDAEFVHMIASGMFSASFEVVLHNMDKESAYRRIHLLEEFHNAGWERVLGVWF